MYLRRDQLAVCTRGTKWVNSAIFIPPIYSRDEPVPSAPSQTATDFSAAQS